jgi:hypothetical protein
MEGDSSRDPSSFRRRSSHGMLSTVAHRHLLAVVASLLAVLAAALVLSSCLGGNGEGTPEGDGRPSAGDESRVLESRPLDLPRVDLHGRSIREYGTAGRCWQHGAPEVGAIALPGVRGWAALGPWPGEAQLRRGPVYAALIGGAPRIAWMARTGTIGESEWRALRTIWVSRPSYDGPVLVRGGRLERPGHLGFGSRARPRKKLRLPAGSWPRGDAPRTVERAPKGWRAARVPTRIRASGCYAFQVDGLGFSYVLAFGVQRTAP